MHPIISDFKTSLSKIVASLKEDLKGIRSGKASPSLIEGIIVETYGGQSKLKIMELASINVEPPAIIAITPYDPSTSSDIEKAILKSPLGITPQPQGGKILLRLPPMTEEQRQKIIKMVGQKAEEKRISLRTHRDEARKKIKHLFDLKEITEDQKFRMEKEIDTISQQTTEEIQQIKEKKDQEILAV